MHGEIVCREYCIKLIRQQDVCHVFMGLEGQLVNLGVRHSRAIYFHTIFMHVHARPSRFNIHPLVLHEQAGCIAETKLI